MQKNTRNLVLIIIIFILSVGIRQIFIADCLYHHDSVQLAKAIDQTTSGNLTFAVGGRQAMVLIYSAANYFIQNGEKAAMLMTIIFAGLCCCVLYLFVLELLQSKRTAFYSAMLLSFSPLFLSITTYAKSHAIAIFFLLLALYIFIKGQYIFAGIVFTAAIFCRVDTLLYFPLFLFMIFLFSKKIKFLSIFGFTYPIIILGFIGIKSGWLYKYGSDSLVPISKVLWYVIYGMGTMSIGMGLTCLIVFLYICAKTRFDKIDGFLFLWSALGFIYFIISVTSPRMYMISIIPLYIITARHIYELLPKKNANFVIIIIVIFSFIQIFPTLYFRHEYCTGKELANKFQEVIQDKSNSIVVLTDEGVFLNYYANIKYIFPQNIKSTNKTVYTTSIIYNKYNLTYEKKEVGTMLWEDYHHSELYATPKNISIYKLSK